MRLLGLLSNGISDKDRWSVRLTGGIRFFLAMALTLASIGFGACATTPVLRLNRIRAEAFPRLECYLSLSDEAGNSLSGLTAENFTILENNRLVTDLQLAVLRAGSERIAVILVLDHSGSMRGKPLQAAQRAAVDFARRLSNEDLLGVVAFSGKYEAAASLTSDHQAALGQLAALRGRGRTALYDAVQRALAELAECQADRKAVIVLTDGYDTASVATAVDCGARAQQQGIVIYCIGLGEATDQAGLRQMSEQSGGNLHLAAAPDNLTGIYREIAGRLQDHYLLSYQSPLSGPEQPWRTVKVVFAGPDGMATDQRQYFIGATAGKRSAGLAVLTPLGHAICAFAILDLIFLAALMLRKTKRAISK